jgi:hypothetical protein
VFPDRQNTTPNKQTIVTAFTNVVIGIELRHVQLVLSEVSGGLSVSILLTCRLHMLVGFWSKEPPGGNFILTESTVRVALATDLSRI